MSLLLTADRASARLGRAAAPGRFAVAGGASSLDDRVTASWEALAAHGSAPCLVCGERMPAAVAAGRLSGACGSCGSELS